MNDARPKADPEWTRRYGSPGASDWQNLLTHFEWSEGFAFLLLLVPDAKEERACRRELAGYLAEAGKTLLAIDFRRPDEVKGLASRLLELRPPAATGAIWVAAVVPIASAEYDEWLAAWREATARLNQVRNSLRRQFDVPLLVVGAPWLQEVLREMAPDLWSVRTLVIRIEPPGGEPITTREGPRIAAERFRDKAYPDPEYALKEAERSRGRPGQEQSLATLLHRAGRGFIARYEWAPAVAALSEAVKLRTQWQPGSTDLGESLFYLGHALSWQDKWDAALASYQQALQLYRAVGARLGEANALTAIGDVQNFRDEREAALASYQQALQLFRAVGDRLGEANVHMAMGKSYMGRNNWQEAITFYEKALPLYRAIGAKLDQANTLIDLGRAYFETGQPDQGMAYVREAGDLFAEMGLIGWVRTARQRLAEMLKRCGRQSEAEEVMKQIE